MKKIKLTLELEGPSGNAFAVMSQFSMQARREGWTREEIEEVITKCKSGDYDNLVSTLEDHCEDE